MFHTWTLLHPDTQQQYTYVVDGIIVTIQTQDPVTPEYTRDETFVFTLEEEAFEIVLSWIEKKREEGYLPQESTYGPES